MRMEAFDINYLGVCLSIRKGVWLAHKPILIISEVEFCFKGSFIWLNESIYWYDWIQSKSFQLAGSNIKSVKTMYQGITIQEVPNHWTLCVSKIFASIVVLVYIIIASHIYTCLD